MGQLAKLGLGEAFMPYRKGEIRRGDEFPSEGLASSTVESEGYEKRLEWRKERYS